MVYDRLKRTKNATGQNLTTLQFTVIPLKTVVNTENNIQNTQYR